MKQMLILSLLLPCLLSAQDEKKGVVEPDPELSVTQHRLTLEDGSTIDYTATAGYLLLRKETGETRAKFFFVAYTLDGVDDPAGRPLTFAFNGGPGSSSVWLHMGALGPQKVVMGPEGDMLPPPFEMADNPHSWLGWTDLVFIDPVETGYSRPADDVDKKEFLGFRNDIESVGAFIRLYTTRNGRWSSPKYLAGESYGTTRASGLAGHLQDRYGMYLNGLVLISQITNFQTARFYPGNDLPFPLFLPTYAATAWYHGKAGTDFDQLTDFLAEVEAFALEAYSLALMKGDRLPPEERIRLAKQLSRYTGLDEDYLLRCHLRPEIMQFTKELLREEELTVGRLDSRFRARDYDAVGERFEFDPSYSKTIYGPFTQVVYDHIRRNLEFHSDLPYEILTGRVHPWNFDNAENRFINVSQTLRQAMHKNPYLRVLICNGYYDLATPYFATQYTVDHLFLAPEFKDNIQMRYFEAGHMMYIREQDLLKFTRDVRDFYRAGTRTD